MVTERETIIESEPAPVRKSNVNVRQVLSWTLASFVVRVLAWSWAVHARVQPWFDEQFYWPMSQGYADLLAHRGPAFDAWERAYEHGIWPPLHALLLGIVSLLTRDPLAATRFLGVVFGAATTALIYCLAARLGNRLAANAAAAIHCLFLPFVFFSHLLYSETLYSLLLVGATFALIRSFEPRRTRYAMLCGALLGLMLLTRAASAMYPIVFVALALSYPGPRIKRALLVGIPALAIALPWLATLYRNEGRFVFLTTGNGYNFYLGNNRYIPPGRGSAWAQHSVLPFLQQEMIADTGDDHMASWDQAGKRRAWAYIREEPLGAVKRAGIRVLETWQPDTYLGKYFSLGVYPPTLLSRPLVFVATLTHYAILLAGLLGLAITRHKSVLIGVIAAGMIGPMLTIGASRFALPLLVILTIPAGCAVARFWERKRAKSLPAVPIA